LGDDSVEDAVLSAGTTGGVAFFMLVGAAFLFGAPSVAGTM